MAYTPEVIDHFEHPRCAGELDGADVRVRVENPVCGDVLELAAMCDDSRFGAVRFKAKGCVASMAAASVCAEWITGRHFDEVAALRRAEVVHALGGLSAESMHVSYLAVDAARALAERGQTLRDKGSLR
jgi:nitrogen fixation protein NifU and related proteins